MKSKSSFIPFANPIRAYNRQRDIYIHAFDQVMSKGNLILQDELYTFEKELSEFCQSHLAIGVASGHAALEIGLKAAKCKVGDKVIVPAHTHIATCSAVVNIGATPIIADIREDFNIDPNSVVEILEKYPEIYAIIPVHMNGLMCDMYTLKDIVSYKKLVLVEDACQALGASLDGKPAGTWGEVGCLSFYPFKNLGCFGDGGAILTNSKEIGENAILLRYNGEDRQTGDYHCHGSSATLDNIQAAFLSVKLRHFLSDINRRKVLAQRYDSALVNIGDIIIPPQPEKNNSIQGFQNYVIRTKFQNQLYKYLRNNGIEVMIHWRIPYYKYPKLDLGDVKCPVNDRISKEIISLPLYPDIYDEEQCHVIDSIRNFFKNEYITQIPSVD